jgi:hypothetical protein
MQVLIQSGGLELDGLVEVYSQMGITCETN